LDAEFNTTGWISSYTGQPIPAEEMRQWTDEAAERILSVKPRRVLEIGCGTGLILFRVAPHCESYVGTDFLPAALDNVRRGLEKREDLRDRVELLERTGDDFDSLADGSFDVIVLNSVVQYFPSIGYLLDVLQGGLRVLSPGGRIFLGDLRNLQLHGALAASTELARAEGEISRRELCSRVFAHIEREEELLIDPAFFDALLSRLPRLGGVDVRLKAGTADNELTRFRYDATLTFDRPAPPLPAIVLDGETQSATPDEIARRLQAETPPSLAVRGVRNSRIAADILAWRLIQDEHGPEDVDELRAAILAAPSQSDA
jgi:SAM-dependent methyltransferase